MAKHIHKAIPKITRPAFERYGFAYAEILSHWPLIVGPMLAACSAPERIRWPAQRRADDKGPARRRTGGMLVVRASDGRAVELQHATPHIIERVNTYYGYEAITQVKIVQGLLPQRGRPVRRPAKLAPEIEAALAREVDTIEDDDLRDALARLGRGALAGAPSKGD
jgi:hypothetical protein